jgi:hypothetical protein
VVAEVECEEGCCCAELFELKNENIVLPSEFDFFSTGAAPFISGTSFDASAGLFMLGKY